MSNLKRIQEIRSRLEASFSPSQLDVIDDSHLHVGHAGAKSGAGHFTVKIASEELNQHPRLNRHRLVKEALADMFTTEIHALSIKILPTTRTQE